MKSKLLLIILGIVLCVHTEAKTDPKTAPKIKVACVGNSITAGAGIKNRDKDSYPMMLGQMLGKEYEVRNFGVSGRTMIQKSNSYMKEKAYKQALDFRPDILIIKLGTNDTNPIFWKYKNEYPVDMLTMIRSFKQVSPTVKIYLCYPVTINGKKFSERDKVITTEVIPMINEVAKEVNAQVIDLHTVTANMPENFVDNLHPNEQGAHILAKTIYKALTGKESTHEIQPFPGLKGKWKGYERYDFTYKNKAATVVCPQKALEGNPWIWRPAFFGVFAYADEALLKEGFHVVYYDLTHEYGCPKSIKTGTDFYNNMVSQYGLSPKVVLEGLSRGGYYALQWGIAHPDKVACMYLDNPVCDMFSWPGKKREKHWKDFLKHWELTDATPETFKENPIFHLQALAQHKVPILAVCGDSDTVVPFAENMKLVRDTYVELGGPVEVIIKPGAEHHPHSLENPEPIVDFILRHQPAYKEKQYYNIRGSLTNSFIRFEKEKKGRVAFFGGSITEMRGWRNMIQEQLKQRFPFTEFDFIDAGIPSTGTTPHAFRLDNDILAKGNIDLLFIEGAVNDHTNGFPLLEQVRGMEGVIRHTLTANPYTDIIMLHFVYEPFLEMFPKGQVPDVILNHERVANHYLIPSINCAREISERIEKQEFSWKDFGGVHPKWFGHKFYAADIQALWDKMWSLPQNITRKEHEIPARSLDKYSYANGKFIDLKEARIKNDWTIIPSWQPKEKTNTRKGFVNVPMLYADSPGATFTYSFKGKAVGLFMACGPYSGIIEYSIDGKEFHELDTFTKWSKSLYLPWLYVLASELDNKKTHTLTIRVSKKKNPKSKGTECVIRNIVINE